MRFERPCAQNMCGRMKTGRRKARNSFGELDCDLIKSAYVGDALSGTDTSVCQQPSGAAQPEGGGCRCDAQVGPGILDLKHVDPHPKGWRAQPFTERVQFGCELFI
jgi:hypothetical protein